MLNLEKTHPGAEDLLKNNGFSVNRSDVPSSRNAVDITIEQTITVMRNLTAELLVSAGTILPNTDGAALDMQEQAICKQPNR